MISSISAVVGGIVIMNVMLVAVTERTKEIGVRRAVGATQSDILRQFLMESVLQCMFGGGIGVMIGFGCALALREFTAFPRGSCRDVGRGAGSDLSSVIGMFFGIYPAVKASKLDPVQHCVRSNMTRHEVRENLLVAFDTLRALKIRSALTILGIVIGVTSVISVAAIIDGLNGYIQSRIQSFGSRSFFVTRIPPGFTGLAPLPQKVRIRKYLDPSDAQYLKDTVDGLDVASAFANPHLISAIRRTPSATAVSRCRV